jgi:hypothetical protein
MLAVFQAEKALTSGVLLYVAGHGQHCGTQLQVPKAVPSPPQLSEGQHPRP